MSSLNSLEERTQAIDRCLPQTQCTQCNYPRCVDYAKAIADGKADINQCPPGGEITIKALAEYLQIPEKPLNTKYGVNEPKEVAFIDESACIGCKLCIRACPVDCIIGTGNFMHTVIKHECTGCKQCLPVCPMDCIMLTVADKTLQGIPSMWPDFTQKQIDKARINTARKLERVEAKAQQRKQRHRIKVRKEMQKEILEAVKRQAEKSK